MTNPTNDAPGGTAATPAPAAAGEPDAARGVAGAFTCTIEDYREATLNVRGSAWRAAAQPVFSAAYMLALWFWVAWLIAVSPEARAGRAAAAGDDSFARLLARTAAAAAPVLLGLPLVFFVTFRYAAGRTPLPWGPQFDPRAGRGATIARLALIMFATMATFLIWTTSGAADWYERFLVVTILLYVIVLLSAFNLLFRTAGTNRRWALQQWLHRPTALEASAEGMTLAESEARHAYRWASFVGFKETPTLLLIYPSPYEHWIVPKRAFASHADLGRFKGLLATHVRDGFFLPAQEPTGFAVAGVPAPLPAVPLGAPALPTPPPLPARAGSATSPATWHGEPTP